jgi:NADH-quinone oxidoreductase subunit F
MKDHPEIDVQPVIKATGCNGWCEKGPLVRIMPEDITYCSVAAKDVDEIVEKTLLEKVLIKRLFIVIPSAKNN